jgi:hypothetical protein
MSGYNSVSDHKLKLEDFIFINSDGEVPELIDAFNNNNHRFLRFNQNKSLKYTNPDLYWETRMVKSKCTAIIKLVRDNNNIKDLLVGHATWSD